jgi:Glu-tRNA(Gln) amidotransferase subunit E-like FAD-binding protein
MSDTNATSEMALNRAFALLKCSPIKDPENSSEYGRAAYNLSEHCQGKEDVSEAAMRIFAERIESLEKQIKDMNNFSNAQYEELERVYKERDEARTALDKMSKYLAEVTGSCPYNSMDEEPHSLPCSEVCEINLQTKPMNVGNSIL